MVDFMFEGLCEQVIGRRYANLTTVLITSLDLHRDPPLHVTLQARHGQTSFLNRTFTLLLDDLRINERDDVLTRDLYHRNPKRHPDLRRGKSHPVRCPHRIDHVINQTKNRRIDENDLLCLLTQNRIGNRSYFSYCHVYRLFTYYRFDRIIVSEDTILAHYQLVDHTLCSSSRLVTHATPDLERDTEEPRGEYDVYHQTNHKYRPQKTVPPEEPLEP
jgi:hypothetical protein